MTIFLNIDALPKPSDIEPCSFYEQYPDEWQGQGAMGALIPGGAWCHLSGDLDPRCQGDVTECPVAGPDGELAQLRKYWKETQ